MTRSTFLRTILCSVAFSAMEVCGMRKVDPLKERIDLLCANLEKHYHDIWDERDASFFKIIEKQPLPTGMGENIKHIERP